MSVYKSLFLEKMSSHGHDPLESLLAWEELSVWARENGKDIKEYL